MERLKPGRKELKPLEKKVSIATYHKLADIKLIGGLSAARVIAIKAIESEINKRKK